MIVHGLLITTSLAAPPVTTDLVVLGEPSALRVTWRSEQPVVEGDPVQAFSCLVPVTAQDEGDATFNTSDCPTQGRALATRALSTATARPLEELGWGVVTWTRLRITVTPGPANLGVTILPGGLGRLPELHQDEVTVRERVDPLYPQDQKWRRVQGDCAVAVDIDTKGRPTAVVPVDCDTGFEAATVEAVEQWRFKPHRVDGELTAYRVVVREAYTLPPLQQDPD